MTVTRQGFNSGTGFALVSTTDTAAGRAVAGIDYTQVAETMTFVSSESTTSYENYTVMVVYDYLS